VSTSIGPTVGVCVSVLTDEASIGAGVAHGCGRASPPSPTDSGSEGQIVILQRVSLMSRLISNTYATHGRTYDTLLDHLRNTSPK